MEMNFSLFFGLAVQLYESTLISDDSPIDRFMAGDTSAMTEEEQLGMDLFVNQLPCINCHKLPEVTKATVEHMIEFPIGIDSIIERMRDGARRREWLRRMRPALRRWLLQCRCPADSTRTSGAPRRS